MLGFMSAPGLTLPAIDAHRTHQFQGIEFGAPGSLSIYAEMLSPARLFLTHRKSADIFRNNQGWEAGGLFLPLEGCGLQAVGARESEGAEPLDTFTILTTEPNELMRPIHN